jgi:hypothetical protein
MTDFSGWKYYQFNGENIGIVSPSGKESRLVTDKVVIKWLEEGNTPLPADTTNNQGN